MNVWMKHPPLAAQRALLYEVSLTPKPGLVDYHHNGSHDDMNFYTFIDSTIALSPYFTAYYETGCRHQGDARQLFERLRDIGKQAEQQMFTATHGINTHKGANFSFALALGATGWLLQNEPFDTNRIQTIIMDMTRHLIADDLAHHTQPPQTHGERLYQQYGITGIRGEAAQGYPLIFQKLLPFWQAHQDRSQQWRLLQGLLLLIAETSDSNMIHRGGIAAAEQAKTDARTLFERQLDEPALHDAIIAFDHTLVTKHLSPGGAADLLALGYYFGLMTQLFS